MKTYISPSLSVALFLVFSSAASQAQQDIGILFMNHLPQTTLQANPAVISNHSFALNLPSIHLSIANNAFSLGDLVQKSGGGEIFTLDQAITQMCPKNNSLAQSLDFSGGAILFKIKKKWQIALFQSVQVHNQLLYPKALAELLWHGNAAYLDQPLEIGPRINIAAYNVLGMSLAGQLNERVSAGVNIKALNGLFCLQTTRSNLTARTRSAYYQLELESDVIFQTGGLDDIFDENSALNIELPDPASFINTGNLGLSLDFGLLIKATDKLSIGASASNIGVLRWTTRTYQQSSKGSFKYDGVTIRPFSAEDDESSFSMDQVLDSLGNLLNFRSTSRNFETTLPGQVSLYSNYPWKAGLSIGAALQIQFWNGTTSINLAGQVQKQLGKIVDFGLNAGYNSRTGLHLGAAASLRLGPIQAFLLSDNLPLVFNPLLGRATNVRLGLNLVFGTKKIDLPEGEKKEAVK